MQLYIGGHALFGTVAWRKDDVFGLRFEDALEEQKSPTLDDIVKVAEAERRALEPRLGMDEIANKRSSKD